MSRNMDYPTLTKRGMLAGLVAFAVGAGGELVGHALYESLPGWESALFFDLEILGILLLLLTPFVFGILLPLTE